MSTIQELIQKQAMAVKNGANANKAAELLEQAAKLLRNDTASPGGNLKAISEAFALKKKQGLAKFEAGVLKMYEADLAKRLGALGFVQSMQNAATGARTFGNRARPGVKVIVTGNKFTITNGAELIQKSTSLEFLESSLKQK